MKLKEAKSLGAEALWLLEKATGLSVTQLRLSDDNTDLEPNAEQLFLQMIKERESHVPLQYILGYWNFMDLTIKCRPNVLIPRRDTEILAEEAMKFLKSCPRNPTALDLCTGTGCVGISLASYCAHIILSDISTQAVELAEENAALNELDERISFVQSDLFEKIEGHFNLITANPPYIPTNELDSLPMEVKKEPQNALDGGLDGLSYYRAIIPAAYEFLLPGGGLFLEIGSTQGKAVSEMLHSNGFKAVVTVKDLENRDRVIRGTKAARMKNQ